MRILLLTQIVPYPPDAGPKVKTYHVLRYLAERGHQITLVSFVRREEAEHLEALRRWCVQVHAVPMARTRAADVRAYAESVRLGQPFLVTRDAKPAMFNKIRLLTQSEYFDIVHADQLTMGQFALAAEAPAGARRAARVLDAHNAVWSIVERARQTPASRSGRPGLVGKGLAAARGLLLRPVLAREAGLLKQYEGALCGQMDAVLAVSEADKRALLEGVEGAAAGRAQVAGKIHVAPIAVDCGELTVLENPAGSREIVTLGTLHYPPNADGVRWFMREVFPLVAAGLPEAQLTVIGPRPPRDLRELAERLGPRVTVTGYVQELEPYLARAAVMVVPVQAASGMRVRILEALARGMAVVTTTMGAEGIDVRDGEQLVVADEPAEFARAVLRLLGDAGERRRLGANGRRLVETKYDWRVVLPRLEAVYKSLA